MSGSRILLVDDQMEYIQVGGSILKENGYHLNIARNGKQALNVCSKTSPDLILLDVVMPEMDGFECCEKLKADEKMKDIPVIFLTSNAEPEDIVKGFQVGAVDYIRKPFNSCELLSRIDTHLSLRKATLSLQDLTKKASRYISPHVFKAIFQGEKNTLLETTKKPLTVFFSDIVGFTQKVESLEDKELLEWLNGYLEAMSDLIHTHGGTLDKFIGDAVMVFFGDPESNGEKEDAIACVRMALEMIQVAADIDVQLRVGIHSGAANVGNFGTEQQMNYTIIGDAVNIAARLESRSEPGQILISESTYEFIKDDFWCEERGKIKMKGIEEEIMTYNIHG